MPPSVSRFLFFPCFPFFPPSQWDLYDTTHHSPGSNSSSRSPNTVTWLMVPPLPASAQGTYRVSPTPGTFPLGARPLSYKGGAWCLGGGGCALALVLGLGLNLGLALLGLGGGRLPRYSRSRLFSCGP